MTEAKAARNAAHSMLITWGKMRRSIQSRRVAYERRLQKKPGKTGLKCDLMRLHAILHKRSKYPVGESNPCLRRERALSWATRRTGRKWRESRIFRHAGPLVNWSNAAAFTT